MGYGNQKGNPPPPAQNNERLSRVKELAVTTAMQIVGMDAQQTTVALQFADEGKRAWLLDHPQDALKRFIAVYRTVYDELTYLPED